MMLNSDFSSRKRVVAINALVILLALVVPVAIVLGQEREMAPCPNPSEADIVVMLDRTFGFGFPEGADWRLAEQLALGSLLDRLDRAALEQPPKAQPRVALGVFPAAGYPTRDESDGILVGLSDDYTDMRAELTAPMNHVIGGTNLAEAIDNARQHLEDQAIADRRIILLVTNGNPNEPGASPAEARAAARDAVDAAVEAGIIVFSVHAGERAEDDPGQAHRQLMQYLATDNENPDPAVDYFFRSAPIMPDDPYDHLGLIPLFNRAYEPSDQTTVGAILCNDCNSSAVHDDSGIPPDFDTDADDVIDDCDNCPGHYNPDQADSNGDGIGDVCDCNGNGIPDEQDIAEGTSSDCNGNSVPDDCDLMEQHNCCGTGHGGGCSDPIIEACICAQDSFCCEVQWDDRCVARVIASDCGTRQSEVLPT